MRDQPRPSATPKSAVGEQKAPLPCRRCREAYPNGRPSHFGSDPRCAFPGGGAFTSDNWQCATAGMARDLVGEYPGEIEREGVALTTSGDQKVAIVSVHEGIDLDRHDQFIPALVMTWYKRRGCTETMLLLATDGTAIAPTADDIEDICAGYSNPDGASSRPHTDPSKALFAQRGNHE